MHTLFQNKKPSERKYYRRREKCYREMKDWDMVISDLRKLMELDPEDQDDYKTLLGEALLDSGKFETTTKGETTSVSYIILYLNNICLVLRRTLRCVFYSSLIK